MIEGVPNTPEGFEPETEYEVSLPSELDVIQAADISYRLAEQIDTALLSKADEKKIEYIKRTSINLIYESIKYLSGVYGV